MGQIIERLSSAIAAMLKRLGHNVSDEASQTIAQAIGFALVGLSNTAVSYALYAITLIAIRAVAPGLMWDYMVAQAVSFLLSVLWSYWWNSRLVFGSRGWRALLKTYASYSITGLFLSSVLLVFWIQVLHVSEFVAPLLSLLVTVPLNFLLNKFWAFK